MKTVKKKRAASAFAAMALCASLAGCGTSSPAPSATPAPTATVSPTPESAAATTEETAALTPVYAADLKDGSYEIEVSSSSSMFRIVKAELTVAEGEMRAVLTLSGTGYGKLYMGTGAEAAADSEENAIPYVEGADGAYTYTVPVAALDQETDVAAWSIKKEKWYDRVLVFGSNQIPAEAFVN